MLANSRLVARRFRPLCLALQSAESAASNMLSGMRHDRSLVDDDYGYSDADRHAEIIGDDLLVWKLQGLDCVG